MAEEEAVLLIYCLMVEEVAAFLILFVMVDGEAAINIDLFDGRGERILLFFSFSLTRRLATQPHFEVVTLDSTTSKPFRIIH